MRTEISDFQIGFELRSLMRICYRYCSATLPKRLSCECYSDDFMRTVLGKKDIKELFGVKLTDMGDKELLIYGLRSCEQWIDESLNDTLIGISILINVIGDYGYVSDELYKVIEPYWRYRSKHILLMNDSMLEAGRCGEVRKFIAQILPILKKDIYTMTSVIPPIMH